MRCVARVCAWVTCLVLFNVSILKLCLHLFANPTNALKALWEKLAFMQPCNAILVGTVQSHLF